MSADRSNTADELRKRAEALLAKSPEVFQAADLRSISKLAHELAVHQAELEIQNEELRDTQLALQRTNDHYSALFQQAPVGYVVLDASGIIRKTNATWHALVESPDEDFRGTSFADALLEEDTPIFLSRFRVFFRNPADKRIIVRIKRNGAPPFHARIEARPYNASHQKTSAASMSELLVIVSDISDLQQARRESETRNEELSRTNERLDHIHRVLLGIRNVNQLIVEEDNPERLIERACENLTETLGYMNVWIALLGGEAGRSLGFSGVDPVVTAASSGSDGGFGTMRERLRRGDYSSCMKSALESENTVVMGDPRSDCPDCPLSIEYAGRSALVRRLAFDGRTYGILTASVPADYAWDAEEQDLFNEVAGDLAFALHKIATARSLEESRRRYLEIFEHSRDGFVMVNAEGRILDANDSYCEMLGYSLEELLAMHDFYEITPERWREWESSEIWQKRLLGQGYSGLYEKEYIRKDGTVFPVELRSYAVRSENGEIDYLWGTARDITKRKKLEKEMLWREEWFRGLYEHNPVGIALVDPVSQRFLQANCAYQSLLGYSEEELRNLTVKDITHNEDWERERKEISSRKTGETNNYEIEKRYFHRDGSIRWVRVTGEIVEDPSKKHLALATVMDMTERKKVENSLREKRERLEFVIEGSSLGTWEWNVQTNETVFNRNWAEMLGYTIEELTPYSYDTWKRLVHPEDLDRAELELKNTIEGKTKDYSCEFRMRSKSGEWVWILDRGRVLKRNEAGKPLLMYGTHTNITNIKKAMEALAKSEQRHRDYITNTPYGVFVTDEKGRYLQVNPAASSISGYSEKELLSMNVSDMLPEEGLEDGLAQFRQVVETGKAHGELVFRHKSGEIRWWQVSGVKLSDKRFLGFCNEITDRKMAEEAILREREQLLSIFGSIDEVTYITDPDTYEILYVNPAFKNILQKDVVGRICYKEFQGLDSPCPFCTNSIIVEQSPEPYIWEYYNPKLDRHFLITDRIIRWSDGRNVRFEMAIDITERKQAEVRLREKTDLLQNITDHMFDLVAITDLSGVFTYVGPSHRILGFEPEELIGTSVFDYVHLEDAEYIAKEFAELSANPTPEATRTIEYRQRCAYGNYKWLETKGKYLFSEDLIPYALFFSSRDITERKRDNEEREKLQTQLQQAMKMEAVGRLAGGVAHDFNNLLTGITGNVSLALMDLPNGDPLRDALEQINQAADSAANLTRQLLAFSRKQLIAPKVLDLNQIIEHSYKMLHRLIGEDIDLVFRPEKKLGQAKVDPGQLEQILMNLAVNARDAMPDGGKLTLETDNVTLDETYSSTHAHVTPGEYVMMAVSDDGIGMTEDVRSRLFEPFFTTKPKDKGTGLGLATVYGAVKQNGGNIEVYSEPEEGTTFKVYFPRIEAKAEKIDRPATWDDLPAGTETVLVVEDEHMVRNIAVKILKRQGYKVHWAKSGADALTLVDTENLTPDLLMTDIIMPGMNGRQLAGKLQTDHQNLKILYTSGYTENVIVHHGVLDKGLNFIGKPYTPQALAKIVREALDK